MNKPATLKKLKSKVRCEICRRHVPTLRDLKSHYKKKHSKIQIIQEILKKSILQATPNVFQKAKKRKYNTIYLHDKVQITYTNDTVIVIEDESSNDNLIELSYTDPKNLTQETEVTVTPRVVPKRRNKKNGKHSKRSKNLFHIGIKKVTETKSLHENTGEFYECHCMEKSSPKISSDTESGSDTGKGFYCNFCGNGYQTLTELTNHENDHQYYCKLCHQIFNLPSRKEHMEQHIVRVYVCHLCGIEFFCKDVLMGHLGYHFEQQTLENILNMEQDYNMYGFCNTTYSSGDYYTNINNILFFLTYPYDHYYSRNMFMKVVCDICYQEFYIYDYERHLKIAHFLR